MFLLPIPGYHASWFHAISGSTRALSTRDPLFHQSLVPRKLAPPISGYHRSLSSCWSSYGFLTNPEGRGTHPDKKNPTSETGIAYGMPYAFPVSLGGFFPKRVPGRVHGKVYPTLLLGHPGGCLRKEVGIPACTPPGTPSAGSPRRAMGVYLSGTPRWVSQDRVPICLLGYRVRRAGRYPSAALCPVTPLRGMGGRKSPPVSLGACNSGYPAAMVPYRYLARRDIRYSLPRRRLR